jgi:hypothetical protein
MNSKPARKHTNRVVSNPEWGRLQQGTIFSGAMAERYSVAPVHGLVITARCDLAHGKAPLINYLPVVSIGDWMVREYADDIVEYLWNETWGKLRSYLSNVGLSQSLLVTVSPQQIRDAIIEPKADTERVFNKFLPKWDEALLQLQVLEPLLAQRVRPLSDLHAALKINRRHAVNEFRRCIQQNMTGYYFLPAVRPDDDGEGWIVLLRSVQNLPPALAHELAGGLSRRDYEQLCKTEERFRGRLDFNGTLDDFAMPVGQINSPFLEHLMQTFSAMFARVGTDDIPDEHIEAVLGVLMEDQV